MIAPDGPIDVAWYDFTSKPGFPPQQLEDGTFAGGNAVFSGHVDYHDYGPAVFWNVGQLEQGDTIEVRLEDGTVYTYAVAEKEQIYADGAAVGEIVGPSANEIITLITCGGTFDNVSGQYDQRVIVRAQRVSDAPGGPGDTVSSP
jgi:LPXTG-site transpeptidase (sortase) family protein